MFEINTYLITKMGWMTYSRNRGLGHHQQLFNDDELVRYFFDKKQYKLCYLIKELSDKEKQKSKNRYKFIKMDYDIYDVENIVQKYPEFEITEFNSNVELLNLIIKNESCNSTYQRHFKLNKIINK